MAEIILASASPRRSDLLRQAGIAFAVRVSDVDETPLPGEPAAAMAERLAIEKAQAVCSRLREENPGESLTVLAADTCVVVEGDVLGKPVDAPDAARMLRRLSGRTHAVMTGVAAVQTGPAGVRTVSDVEITQVEFDLLDEDEIAGYIRSGEPLDKAGAYAIQGYAARWIPRIEGDYFNVVGLPIARVVRLLREVQDVGEPGK